jgi:hypothetical protein
VGEGATGTEEALRRESLIADAFALAALARFLGGEARFQKSFPLVLQLALVFDPATGTDPAGGLSRRVRDYHDRFLREAFRVFDGERHIAAALRDGKNIAMDLEPDDPRTEEELRNLKRALDSEERFVGRMALVPGKSVSPDDARRAVERAGIDLSDPRVKLLMPGEAPWDAGQISSEKLARVLAWDRLDLVYAVDPKMWFLSGATRLIEVLLGGKVYDAQVEIGVDLQEKIFTLIQA